MNSGMMLGNGIAGTCMTILCAVRVLLLLWPVREHQNINTRLYRGIYVASYRNKAAIIGRKRSSNDTDLIQPDQYIVPKNKKAKIPPPKP